MLPKNKLGKAMAKKLKVYADGEHPHTAQRPQAHQLTTTRSNQENQV
jgi:large subunit ribosomal protein L13